ncbi:hypothetical protein ACFVIM_03315 [Streptomyces sp. NPDC057638]|uniref:hypothetical protein n=1 Tax=Streptomyces sp. NPDC057638 TaxID=3346190 RepID=UPI0036B06DEC
MDDEPAPGVPGGGGQFGGHDPLGTRECRIGGGVVAEVAGEQHGVDLAAAEQDPADPRVGAEVGLPAPARSTGLRCPAPGGSSRASTAAVVGERTGTRTPRASSASAARAP